MFANGRLYRHFQGVLTNTADVFIYILIVIFSTFIH